MSSSEPSSSSSSSGSSVLEDIVDAIDLWTQQLLDAESRLKKTQNIRENVANSLQRQVLDGLISESDSFELEYTTDLWLNLHKSFLCKCVGADFSDRDVLHYLVELYTLKQISKELFTQIVLELCRRPPRPCPNHHHHHHHHRQNNNNNNNNNTDDDDEGGGGGGGGN